MLQLTTKTVLMIAVSMLLSTAVFAQSNKAIKPIFVKNLIAGITNENEGLKRSSIYYAGEYKIPETAQTLVSVFSKEKSQSNKILIAFSLYRIGDQKSIESLKQVCQNESDQKVLAVCNAVVEQFK